MDQAKTAAARQHLIAALGSHHPMASRRPNPAAYALLAGVALLLLGPAGVAGTITANSAPGRPASDVWVGAWEFPPISFPGAATDHARAATGGPIPDDFDDLTVRQIVRLAAAALRVRVRLSNEFGEWPMQIGTVHLALAGNDGAIIPGSDHVLTFSGRRSIAIPAGAPLVSDPIDWRLPALSRLAVSIYLPARMPPPAHRASEYVSSSGDFSDATVMPGGRLLRTGALVSEVDVVSPNARHVIVTLGDSITEGFGSTVNEFRGWSDRLAERLSEDRAMRTWTVVNAGINSNRLLHNDPGMAALARFDRDVLAVPGAAMVILYEGINDIGYSHTVPAEAVSVDDIISAYRQLIARAHGHGIAIVGCTLTPFQDSHYYVPEGEQTRLAVNRWIRNAGEFDAVIDFDAAMRDPANPVQVNPALQRGDHLHPNDAGYAVMGRAIDLRLIEEAAQRGARPEPNPVQMNNLYSK
jgi:lysophospholipase L1-like esterase